MSQLTAVIRKNWRFFTGFLLYAVIGLALNLIYTQRELFFFINNRNAPGYDATMPYITFIGDGIIFAAVILILFFIKIRYGIIALVAWLVESTIVQVCKLFIFNDQPRPWKRWGDEYDIYLIEGFKPYSNNSFPSGHTASAFCMFTLLALFVAHKKSGLLFLLIAILVAYSRIYLAQHYFIDTYVGAWIGVFSATAIYLYFYAPNLSFNRRESILDKPLIKYRK